MLPFFYLNTFMLTCCLYRTFLKMREYLAPLQSPAFHFTIVKHNLKIFITGHVEPGKISLEVCMFFCVNICRLITFIIVQFFIWLFYVYIQSTST